MRIPMNAANLIGMAFRDLVNEGVEMAKKKKAKKESLKCPACGWNGQTQEHSLQHKLITMVPIYRRVEGAQDGNVFLDFEGEDIIGECDDERGFTCGKCNHLWNRPEGMHTECASQLDDGEKYSDLWRK